MTTTDANERATRVERYYLASALLEPFRLKTTILSPQNFLLTEHAAIYSAMRKLDNSGAFDLLSIADELAAVAESKGFKCRFDYLVGLLNEPGAVPECIDRYAREVRKCHAEREFLRICEELPQSEPSRRRVLLTEAMELVGGAL